jgi:Glu-tRNA(Gln) amidotransferase subunit E-like FAD-binding protein
VTNAAILAATQRTANVEPRDAVVVSRAGGGRMWIPATNPGDYIGVMADGTIGYLRPVPAAKLPYQGDVPMIAEPTNVPVLSVAGVVTVSGMQALADQVKALRAALNLEIAARNVLVQRMVSAGLMATG